MVTGILLAMVVTAVNSLRLADRRAQVQRNALLLVNRLGQELGCAHPESLIVDAGLTFLSSRTSTGGLRYSAAGQRLWLRWLNVSRRSDRTVMLRQWPITAPASPPYLTPPGAAAGGWSERPVARQVQAMEFQKDARGAIHLQLVTEYEGVHYELNTVLGTSLTGG